ncbi:MAG TPA: SpaA isopeptide-forming pilin-related protein [Acidimicrobiales bacterium]|nr:SpaA isopeptide-forming pilin-related protein [Acidimicrobiales bacterium]
MSEVTHRRFTGRCVLAAVVALGVVGGAVAAVHGPSAPAGADGPAPCTSGPPPYPFHGFCATYSGANTWYGSYGPGFPTAQGWGLCANLPASGGEYPAPSYGYVPGGAPAGASTAGLGPLGFAFGQGQAAGWWDGSTGQFTADQAAVAAKLLYDSVVWGSPVPSMDPGVLAAFDDFDGWYNQAAGLSGAPGLVAGLVAGGDTFTGSALFAVHVAFPGSGRGLDGLGVLLSITNGTFNTAEGPTFIGVSTDANGNAVVPIFADGSGAITLTVATLTQVGQPGVGFYHQSTGPPGAQLLAGFPAPIALGTTEQLYAQPAAAYGTVSVAKSGDDQAYVGVGGAVFDVDHGSQVAAVLTTDGSGATPKSPPLETGSYIVHEASPPPGYQAAPDTPVTVVAQTNTVVTFGGASVEHVVPAQITIAKADAASGSPLAGAVFDVRYDSAHDGVYDRDLGDCSTDATGRCSPAADDGAGLLPGDYQITELQAPPGYDLDPTRATQTITVAPGQHATVTFSDQVLGSLRIEKSGDDTAYQAIAGAVFELSGPAPSTTPVATLTVGQDGSSNTASGLEPGTYTVTETMPPPGYQAVGPIQVAVADGPATTVVDVLDHVQPSTLSLVKVDRLSGAPLGGAVLDVRYDPSGSGSYPVDLGTCTTSPAGACDPVGNDGASRFLPGDYQVTETAAPPGYYLDPATATVDVRLQPGSAGTARFDDPPLVGAAFQKVATGNVDPAQVIYGGAVIDVTTSPPGGPTLATCTTDVHGTCTTAAVLVAGDRYCWAEESAPPGLAAGAGGCFTAAGGQADLPIEVTDPGMFVAVQAKKVDQSDPTVGIPGATFDLYRRDGGTGPDHPTPPPDAATEPAATWLARATSGPDGLTSFPLQFPGYAYCVVEHAAPPGYVGDPTPRCTPVLTGTTSSSAPPTVVTVDDAEALITLSAHKYNATQPDTGIPGAVYDLYVEGNAPPSGVPSAAPADVTPEPGDTWYGRGTSDASGNLRFTVPAGYAWCLHEVHTPSDYVPDPSLHCTSVLLTSPPGSPPAVALPETLATVHLSADKYNSTQPNTVIPGASYEVVAEGRPTGAPADPPSGVPVPAGDEYWAQGTSDEQGQLTFAVPAGYAWCLHELAAPPGYQPDTSFHCTSVITTDSLATAATVALPEQPSAGELAFTGGPVGALGGSGAAMAALGAALTAAGRRRRNGGTDGAPPTSGRPPKDPPGRGGRSRSPVRRRLHTIAVAVIGTTLVLGVASVVPGSPARAAGTPDPSAPVWWSPLPSYSLHLGSLFDLSCATPSFCVSLAPTATHPPSFVSRFDGAGWSVDTLADLIMAAVSCPTTSFCMALDHNGEYTTFDGSGWSAPQPSGDYTPGDGAFFGGELSCPTDTWCMAIDERGSALSWTPSGGWSPLTQVHNYVTVYPADPPPTVSCPSPTECTAAVGGDAYRFNGTAWSPPSPVSAEPLWRVSCPVAGWCLAVDGSGQSYASDGGPWTPAGTMDTATPVTLSCSTSELCVAVDVQWRAVVYRNGAWGAPQVPVPGSTVNDVSCAPGASWCLLGGTVAGPAGSTEVVSFSLAAPLPPAASLGAPTTATAGPSGLAQVTVTPSLSGFVAASGPDGWQASYQWSCAPQPDGPPCPPGSGAVATPPADAAGSFDGTVASDEAPATTDPPFPVSLPPGVDTVGVRLTDTASGAVALATTTVTVSPGTAACTPDITPVSGGGSAPTGHPFSFALVAEVDCRGAPVADRDVVFTLPGSGPSGTFTGGALSATVPTGTDGRATSPALTAGDTPGSWTAVATTAGAPTPARYDLANDAPSGAPPDSPPPPGSPPSPASGAGSGATGATTGLASSGGPPAPPAYPATLAYTGGPGPELPVAALDLILAGAVALRAGSRRRRRRGVGHTG